MFFNQKEVTVGSSFNGYTSIKNTDDFTDNDLFLVKGAFNLITQLSSTQMGNPGLVVGSRLAPLSAT